MASNRLAKVVITLDGSRVEVGLDKIRQKTQEVVAKMQTLANAGKQNTKEYKECVKALNTLHKAETDVASVQQRINTYMKELGNVATTDLRRAYREGIQLREGFKGTDKELQKLNHDLAAMKAQIDKNTGSTTAMTKAQMGFVGSLKTTLKNLVAYAGVFALFNQIKGAIISIGKKNLEFSDELTNIRKVSQLAEEDINKLANSLAKIDTRSSVHELNNLAYAGAKLGMQEHGGVAALESFVKAADKVNVALKEDLGDDALVAMSKLVEVMGLIPKMGIEKSMDAAGSAIFTLSTSSTATGANIIEFSKRLMGLANVSHVTTAELLALGSASDAMGLMPEVSSTAFNKVFTNIQSNTAAIEKSLDFTKGALQELINDGKTMEAMTAVFTKMHGMSMAELKGRGVFQALGSDGARLNNVMTTMADRVDMLTQHLEMSNKAFEEGTAVQKEYEMQMESAQGYMERSANLWEKALVNPEGVDAMKEFAKAWYNLSQTLSTSTLYMGQIKLTLKGLITAMEAIITLAPFLIDFFMLKGVVQGIKYLNSMRLAFLANKAAIEGMTEAQLAANKAMKANVYIAIAAAVITLGQYIYELSVKTDDAEKAQERLNGALSEGAVAAQREVGHLNNVIKALDNAALSQQGREKVIADFNQKYGQYINALGIEIKTVDDLRKNYNALAGAIRRAAYERVKDKFKEQELEPLIKASIEAGADLQKGGNAQTNAISVHDAEQAVSNFSKAIQTLTAKNLKKFRETYKQELQAIGLDPKKATVEQIKAKSTPADTRKIFNQSAKNGPRSLNEYLMNLIDKGEITNAADAYKNIIMKEFSEGAKFGAVFDENLNYVVGQRTVNGRKVGTPVTKGTGAVGGEKSSAFNKKLYENVEKFVDAYLAVKNRGDEIDSAFDPYIRVPEPQGDNKIKPYEGGGEGGNGGTDDKSKKLKDDFDKTKKQVEGLIAKIDEWYNLQEAAVKDAEATGEMTKKEADDLVQAMEIARNDSLMRARKAVGSGEQQTIDDWTRWAKTVLPSMLADSSKWSRNLMNNIQEVDAKALHDFLATLKEQTNDPKVMAMLDASSFFDTMMKKSAESKKKAEVLRAKFKETLDGYVKQYDVIIRAQDKMRDDLQSLGIMTETPEQMAARLANGGAAPDDRQQYAQMGGKFIGMNTIPYTVDITNKDDALYFIEQLTHDADGAMEQWAQAFPKLMEWVNLYQQNAVEGEHLGDAEKKAIEEAMPQIQALYYQLMNFSDGVSANIKKQVEQMTSRNPIGIDEMKSQHEQRVSLTTSLYDQKINEANNNGDVAQAVELEKQKKQALIDLEYQFQNEMYQIREQMGTTWYEQYEKEVAMYKNMLDKKLISEREFQKKKKELDINLGLKNAQYFNGLMSNMVNALQEAEIASVEAKYDAEINAAKAAGQDTTALEEQKEAEIFEIRKRYAGMQLAVKISEIIANTAVAIMMAYAQLGPIAGNVAAAMLGVTGAAQLALAIAEYNKVMSASAGGSSKASSTGNATKTKLVSGMLTYDKGNVQRFIGQDGKVYTATAEPAPKDGLVTHPIATTVQGQPALVAENGPEIVIGRETTKAIMMNEPELIRYLANYQQQGGRRLFDGGNAESVVGGSVADNAGTERQALINRLDRSDALMEQVLYFLQNPVAPEIAMYDTGGKKGLHTKMQEANKFMARYGG